MATRSRRTDSEEARRAAAAAQIRQFPDPVLKQPARVVEAFDDDLAALAERMLELMDDAHGAGLAAPQIGLLRRLFVYRPPETEEPRVLVNPRLVEASAERAVEGEGCLSLDVLLSAGHQVPVERHERVRLHAVDVAGAPFELDLAGHEARIVQHELDHLDGVLILDRAERAARIDAMRLLRQAIDAEL